MANHFVFFQPDEMRAESLACYGHPLIKTPNYDRSGSSKFVLHQGMLRT